MIIDDKIKDEKLQYNINREAAEISALSPGKIDKYKHLTGEEILPSDQSTIIQQAKFTYSPLGKPFEKQIKTIDDQGIKHVKALKASKPEVNKVDIKSIEGIFPKNMRTNEIKNEIYGIKQGDLEYMPKNYTCDFQQYETIRSFGDNIYTGKISIDEAEMDQSNLLKNIIEFYNKSRPITIQGTDKIRYLSKCI